VQITVFMPNAWNIQTFTIYLLTFDQFWWNFTWQGIFALTSWCMTKILRILKSSLKLRKISIFFYSLPQNSGKSANNRFHAKLVKYSNFYDIFADVWPILRKKLQISFAGEMREIFELLQYLCYCLTNLDEISHSKPYSNSEADE